MNRPRFLTVEFILKIHSDQLEKFGGRDGVRQQALLESAANMPAAAFGGDFVHSDLPETAAAYLFYLNRNHPFIDGNKRSACQAALVFLDLNGVDFVAPDEELTAITLAIAAGTAGKDEASSIFPKHCGR